MERVFVRTKKRRTMAVCREAELLEGLLGGLPGEETELRLMSFCRISAAGFVRFVADRAQIRRLSVATFRLGPRAIRMLGELHGQGKLLDARFVLGRMAAARHAGNNEEEYWARLRQMCQRNGWTVCSINNHSKVALFDTDRGKFVLEGSANLNEAPNWEQYTWQQDGELYAWYDQILDEMISYAARADSGTQLEPDEPADEPAGGELAWPEQRGLSW